MMSITMLFPPEYNDMQTLKCSNRHTCISTKIARVVIKIPKPAIVVTILDTIKTINIRRTKFIVNYEIQYIIFSLSNSTVKFFKSSSIILTFGNFLVTLSGKQRDTKNIILKINCYV